MDTKLKPKNSHDFADVERKVKDSLKRWALKIAGTHGLARSPVCSGTCAIQVKRPARGDLLATGLRHAMCQRSF